jgi:hypothetical protein
MRRSSTIVAYKPTRPGVNGGTLTVSVDWDIDGHVETQTVALHGLARTLASIGVSPGLTSSC